MDLLAGTTMKIRATGDGPIKIVVTSSATDDNGASTFSVSAKGVNTFELTVSSSPRRVHHDNHRHAIKTEISPIPAALDDRTMRAGVLETHRRLGSKHGVRVLMRRLNTIPAPSGQASAENQHSFSEHECGCSDDQVRTHSSGSQTLVLGTRRWTQRRPADDSEENHKLKSIVNEINRVHVVCIDVVVRTWMKHPKELVPQDSSLPSAPVFLAFMSAGSRRRCFRSSRP